MSDPFVAEIRMFAGNFAPNGWAFCDGSILSIASNTALFSLLGTTYGGDGRTTFALPDLRGRAPVHQGTGPGLPTVSLGEVAGVEIRHTAPAFLSIHSLGVRDRPLRIVITAISCYTRFAKLNYPGVSHQKS